MKRTFEKLSLEEKIHHIESLGCSYNPDDVVFLLDILNSKNEADLVRISATKSVALKCLAASSMSMEDSCAKKLLFTAENDKDDDVRNYALQALSWFTNIEWIPKAVESIVLNKNEDPLVREAAFSILASQKNSAYSKLIFRKLLSDPVFSTSSKRYLIS